MYRKFSPLVRLALAALLLSTVFAAQQPAPARSAAFGPVSRSALLNGTDSYIEVPDHPALNPTSALTIEAWVYRSNASRCETIVGKDFASSYWLGLCTEKLRFYSAGGSPIQSNSSVPAGRWTHVAVTFVSEGRTASLYINGELDSTTSGSGLTLPALAESDAPLGIGYDMANDFTNNAFQGYLDEVRLWNVARSQEEIQADLYQEIGARAGLVAAWRLNGRASNAVSFRHEGIVHGALQYSIKGVLPRDISVPRSTSAVSVDGTCDTVGEYSTAERVTLHDFADTTIAYLHHADDDLFICIEGLEQLAAHSAAVAIDRDNSRDEAVQAGDYRFIIGIDGAASAQQGDGAGSFAPFAAPAESWEAARTTALEFVWSAEFRISRDLLELPADWNASVGMDLVELGSSSEDNHWPVGAVETSPATWASVRFVNTSGAVPSYTFSGQVLDTSGSGIADVVIQFYASNAGGTSLIGTTTTDSTGGYTLIYTGYSPAAFLVQEVDPRGAYSVSADAGGDGDAPRDNLLIYPGSALSKSYSPGTFVDSFGVVPAASFDRHYLIVHSSPVGAVDLGPLIDMKRLQGFQVEAISTEAIADSVSGRDLAEKIRNWLKSRWESHRPAPVYALLVGQNNLIPIRQVGWEGDTTHRTPDQPDYAPAILTDWYYADLDSNWDSDGDGFYGEYVFCVAGENEVPNPADPDTRLPCPAASSPLREGPYGTLPGTEDDWKAEIAIGRILLNDPVRVRRALQTSAAAEMSGSFAKRSAITAGAFWGFDGRSWNADLERFVDGGQEGSDGALYYPWDGEKPYGLDTAEHLAVTLRPILDEHMDTVTTLYESSAPGDDPALSPTRRTPDFAVTPGNMQEQWNSQAAGLVNAAGHGNGSGVWGQSWVNDWNSNGQIDNPAQPEACETPPCWEIGGWQAFLHGDMPEPAAVAPVVFANACSTGDGWSPEAIFDESGMPTGRTRWLPGGETVAGKLPGTGKAVAWVGAHSIVAVTGLNGFQDAFNRDALGGLPLGDAVWNNMTALIGNGADWRGATPQLFGDPAYVYWGNPADTRGYWPQDGHNGRATSSTRYNGPSVGSVLWTSSDNAPQSPPVVDRFGNLVVGAVGRANRVAPDGALLDDVTIDVVPPGLRHEYAPALATDGVYIASAAQLYSLDLALDLREVIPLGSGVTGAPRVGPDGVVWVPTAGGMTIVSGAGEARTVAGGIVSGPVAFLPAGAAVWTTDDGALLLRSSGRTGLAATVSIALGSVLPTPPAVGPDGAVYIGFAAGFINARTDLATVDWSYNTGAAITARPAIGPDGTIYVGNADGTLTALSPEGVPQWSTLLDAPLITTPAVDAQHVYVAAGARLYALDSASGAMRWSVELGASVDERGTPVIGANRTVYVTTSTGRLVAVGEAGWLVAPSDLLAEPEIGGVRLRWRDNSAGEIGFRVDRCTLEGVCSEVGSTETNSTTLTIELLPPREPFRFRVQALGSNTGIGLAAIGTPDMNEASDFIYSDVVAALPPPPVAPTDLQAAADSAAAIRISWSDVLSSTQLAGFDIYRSTSAAGSYQQVGSAAPDATSFLDDGLTPDTTYFYQVRARTEGGASDAAGPASATTKAIELPAPTILQAVPGAGRVGLIWENNATSETGYVVERRPPGLAEYELLAIYPADTTSASDTRHLTDGVFDAFEYRVKAVNATSESPYAYATARLSAQVSAPVAAVEIGGPLAGTVNISATFVASVRPSNTVTPIAYTWQTDGQPAVQHTGALSDSIELGWSEAGTKTITVTASNASGTVVDTHEIIVRAANEIEPLTGVTIAGAPEGRVGVSYAFTATISPLVATPPISYTWQASGQERISHSSNLPSDSAAFVWDAVGTQTITVTAVNAAGVPVLDTHTIEITAVPTFDGQRIYLPLVRRALALRR